MKKVFFLCLDVNVVVSQKSSVELIISGTLMWALNFLLLVFICVPMRDPS